MKVDIKNLSVFLVVINTLVMSRDLPVPLLAFVFGIIILSFLITNKIARTFFKLTLLLAGLALIKYLFKTFLTTEAGVSFVMILSALKLWELDHENDHFNMFLILALLECCLFLLNPTFIAFFLGMIKIFIFFYFILKIRNYNLALLSGKRLFLLMAPSLLLSLILFYTFPRFTQGFLSATNNQLLFSGTDSQISFKKLGPISLSSNVVFKAYGLSSQQFPLPYLYWRQSILWDYYLEEWRTGYINLKSEQYKTPGPVVSYSIQLVQDYNEFLPVLDGVTNLVKSNLDYNFFSEMSFRLKNISRTPVAYEANTSFKEVSKTFTPLMERKGLRLNSPKKEEIKRMILNSVQQKSILSDEQKLAQVITFFESRQYSYTLSPPAYNSIEDFILYGKAGYCSHFAAAFTYLSRSVGLPARIVSGYQGGEFNPFDQSLIVRELDGHVWVEVYLAQKGWTRFDPTALVAPGRIELGANQYNEKIEPFIDLYYYKLPKSFLKFTGLNQFSLWLDSLNTQFDSSISNFDKEKQQQVLKSFIPKSFSVGWIFALALSGSLPLFWFFYSVMGKQKIHPNEKRYRKFIARMKKEGIEKLPYESATSFRHKCLAQTNNLEDTINSEIDHYIRFYYE